MSDRPKTFAVLYPGEMGAAFAAILAARGHRVVTTMAGRGEQTAHRCKLAGISVLPSLEEVARVADVVVSLVPPGAAEEVARAWCGVAYLAPAHALYVDANSIGPELAADLAERFSRRGIGFVDAAINGLAKNLATSCTLFFSGPRAGEAAQLIGDSMKVRLLGDTPGRASAMKMLLSGLSKGICALFVETALTAHRHGMLAEMTEGYTRIYPGVMGIVERMLPTYPRHAGRRAEEMSELQQTAESAEVEPVMLAAARRVHELLAAVEFGEADESGWDIQSVVECLAANGFLLSPCSDATDFPCRAGIARREPKSAGSARPTGSMRP